MNTATAQNQKGFTLVEIAIVLVIIGLLLGGVLKGQELITNSKIKAVTGDLEGIAAAYYAFQDRTGVVAGDTNDDGLIDDESDFWNDLRREGFISGAVVSGATSGPRHDLDGNFSADNGNFFGTRNYICASNIEDPVARGMDTKLDDGTSNSGVIRATTDGTTVLGAYTGTATDIVRVCKEL